MAARRNDLDADEWWATMGGAEERARLEGAVGDGNG
jgi:hypothetical protein